MLSLSVTVSFHGPFRSGTGAARDAVDDPVDATNPLPGSALKGVMRAAAAHVLELPAPVVDEVFGATGVPCCWAWGDGQLEDPRVRARARVPIHHETATAIPRGLHLGEEVWTPTATFTIEQFRFVPPKDLDRHRVVLCAAALATHSVGSDRRRGLGWLSAAVDVVPDGLPDEDHQILDELMGDV